MAFTMLDGAQDIATFFVMTFQRNIYVEGQKIPVFNDYATLPTYFCFNLVSLQSWLFAMKYWESVTIFSFTQTIITP